MIQNSIFEAIIEKLDVPDSAYESAQNRYEDIGSWLLNSHKAKIASYEPRVYSQGSFQLGTVVKPLQGDEYDLDIVCVLQRDLTKAQISQRDLKELLGTDLADYRTERQIQDSLIEKQRCWRLNYQDKLPFHLDILPALAQSNETRMELYARMIETGFSNQIAQNTADLAIAITDKKNPNYRSISPHWPISNPEGYANWFKTRMRLSEEHIASRTAAEGVRNIDDLPTYKWRTPLQQAIQLLKRHRDIMFEANPDGKPISIIITTLAALAYQGQADLGAALHSIVSGMEELINQTPPLVPNPVNPNEDFTDKWRTPEGRRQSLEPNFHQWLKQVKIDIDSLINLADKGALVEQANRKFKIEVRQESFNIQTAHNPHLQPRFTKIANVVKPWRE